MEKRFEVTGPVQLDIELASGDIRIDRGDDGFADVELVASDPDSQELVDEARVELRGSELVVHVPNRRGGFNLGSLFGNRGITCRIRCAEGSSLKSRTKSGDVEATIALGRADLSTASGDVTVRDVTGDLSFKGASGDISAERVGGKASVNTASGDVSIAHVGGQLAANSASGDISVDAVDGDAKANTASGDISLDVVMAGEITINSASGDVNVGVRRGSQVFMDCSTVSGDARSELDATDEPNGSGRMVHIKARTVSGDISITRAAAPAGNSQEVQA